MRQPSSVGTHVFTSLALAGSRVSFTTSVKSEESGQDLMSRANEFVLEILQKELATGHSANRIFLGQFNVGNVHLLLCPVVQG